jgi:hypothetical protein
VTANSFLDQAATFVYKELERIGGDPTKLEVPMQTVAVLYTVQAMIDNGGFRYIFESDFPFCPPYSVFSDAYRRIGAVDAAECLDKAVAMFPFEKPYQCQEKRNAFMDSLEESHEMFELGDQVCGDETIWSALEEYAKKNAGFFQVM